MPDPTENPDLREPRLLGKVRVFPLASLFLWGLAFILLLHFWDVFTLIFLGFLAAWAVAALLRPLSEHVPGPRGLKAVVTIVAFIAVVAGAIGVLTLLMVKPVQQEIEKWPQLKHSLDELLYRWGMRLGGYPVTVDQLSDQLTKFFLGQGLGGALSAAADISAMILIVLGFIFIGSMYLLAEPPGRLVNTVSSLLPIHLQQPVQNAFSDLEPRLRFWLLGTLVGMTAVGIASYIGYMLVGLQFAAALAIFAGASEAVPTIGTIMTLCIALMLGGTQGTEQVIGVAIVYAVVQTLESYVLIPLIMRRAVDISPVVTLFTIVFWGKLLGLAGLLLAIPLDLVIWTMLDHMIIRRHRQPAPEDVAPR